MPAQLPDPAGQGPRLPADPEVTAALAASGVPDLAVPTLAHGESWRDVRDVTSDADAVGARGMGYERLDQLALEHLYGIR